MISRKTNGIHIRMQLSVQWLRFEPQKIWALQKIVSNVYCVTVREVCGSDLTMKANQTVISIWKFYLRWPVIHWNRSRHIAFSKLTRLRAVQLRNRVSNIGRGSNFIINQSINTVSGAHPASNSMGTKSSFTGNKSVAAVNRHLHLVPWLWMTDHTLLSSLCVS